MSQTNLAPKLFLKSMRTVESFNFCKSSLTPHSIHNIYTHSALNTYKTVLEVIIIVGKYFALRGLKERIDLEFQES